MRNSDRLNEPWQGVLMGFFNGFSVFESFKTDSASSSGLLAYILDRQAADALYRTCLGYNDR